MHLLETERNKILLMEEARWWQQRRATWIKCGDLNTKKFHRFTSSKQNKKHIWEILDDSGNLHSGKQALKTVATTHFKYVYEASTQNNP
jgi:hypothetical protein